MEALKLQNVSKIAFSMFFAPQHEVWWGRAHHTPCKISLHI